MTSKEFVVLSRKELEKIASTPPSECAVCNDILEHAIFAEHYLVDKDWLKNAGYTEHLEQIVGELKVIKTEAKENEQR